MNKYGQLPVEVGAIELKPTEMLFYQYMPIKLSNSMIVDMERRLNFASPLIGMAAADFKNHFGDEEYMKHYIYLTAKYQYQKKGLSFNREGYHSDGFMTNDINYIWSDTQPTVFNTTDFSLTQDDTLSLKEMEDQAKVNNQVDYPNNTLLRLDQYNIHKVGECKKDGMRLFIKISFSLDKYDLIGNAKNYNLNYDWDMKPRKKERNIPQSELTEFNK